MAAEWAVWMIESTDLPQSGCSVDADGFTLVEMAVVLIIVSLLLGGLLVPLTTQVEITQRQETERVLAEFQDVLIGFALINGRLPCPDTNTPPDGQENLVGNSCANVAGTLPWITLGTTERDSWNNRFSYRVTATFADAINANTITPPGGCGPLPAQSSFALCTHGDIDLVSAAAGGMNVVVDAPAVVISHGKNGVAASSADELENTDGDSVYVYKDYSSVAGSEYDDLLIWISPNVLGSRMLAAGRLP